MKRKKIELKACTKPDTWGFRLRPWEEWLKKCLESICRVYLSDFPTNYTSNSSICSRLCTYQFFSNCCFTNPCFQEVKSKGVLIFKQLSPLVCNLHQGNLQNVSGHAVVYWSESLSKSKLSTSSNLCVVWRDQSAFCKLKIMLFTFIMLKFYCKTRECNWFSWCESICWPFRWDRGMK